VVTGRGGKQGTFLETILLLIEGRAAVIQKKKRGGVFERSKMTIPVKRKGGEKQ